MRAFVVWLGKGKKSGTKWISAPTPRKLEKKIRLFLIEVGAESWDLPAVLRGRRR